MNQQPKRNRQGQRSVDAIVRARAKQLARRGRGGWQDDSDRIERIDRAIHRTTNSPYRVTTNNWYCVQWHKRPSEWGELTLLMISRHDKAEINSWDEIQRIKNELVGEDTAAIEAYPPQRDVINVANIRHIWVVPGGLPFTL